MHIQISCGCIFHDNYVIDNCRSGCHETVVLCSLVCNFAWEWLRQGLTGCGLSKACEIYAFMSCVAQILILCQNT